MADKKIIKRQQADEQVMPTYEQMSEGVYDRGTKDLFKTDQEKKNWNSKVSNQNEIQSRKQQIEKLLSDYESKVRGQKMGKVFTGIQARTAAIHNPALAKSILETQSPLDTQESDLVKQKMNLQGQKLKNIGSMQSVEQTDDDNDKNSPKATMARQVLKQQFGIEASPQTTWRQINQVFPMIKVDTQRDTQQRGQDIVHGDKVMADQTRQAQGQKNRGAAQKRAETMAGASIQRQKMSNAADIFITQLKQDAKVSGAARKDLNSLRQRNIPGLRFLDPQKKIPSSRDHEQAKRVYQSQRGIKSVSSRAAQILSSNPRALAVTENGRKVAQDMIMAVKLLNKGILAEGVTNGKDMEYGLNMALGGDSDGFVSWLQGDKGAMLKHFIENLDTIVAIQLESNGYQPGQMQGLDQLPVGASGGSSGRTGALGPGDANELGRAATGLDIGIQPKRAPAPFGAQPQSQQQGQPTQAPVSPAKQRLLQKIRGK